MKVQDVWQPGYVIEENCDGTHTIFVPRAPLIGTGQVYVVESAQIPPPQKENEIAYRIEIDFRVTPFPPWST